MADGQILKAYIEGNEISRTKLATDLRITRQGLYVLFKSKEMEPETKTAIEKALKIKWSDIEQFKKDNIDDNVSRETGIDMMTMTMKPTFGEKGQAQATIQALEKKIIQLEAEKKMLQELIDKLLPKR